MRRPNVHLRPLCGGFCREKDAILTILDAARIWPNDWAAKQGAISLLSKPRLHLDRCLNRTCLLSNLGLPKVFFYG